MSNFANEFSWSKSRKNIFDTCLRQYYYHYYGSWGGWEYYADERTRNLYIMKNLTNRPMWIGTVVHKLADEALFAATCGNPWTLDQAFAILHQTMTTDWDLSRHGRFKQRPNKMIGLAEHYYNLPLPDDALDEDIAFAEICVRNLFESVVWQAAAKDILVRVVEREKLESIEVNGTKVWLKIDLALASDGQYLIVDWKTGRSATQNQSDVQLQLAVYALYAARMWSIPINNLHTKEVYLGTAQEMPSQRVDSGILNWAADYIARSAQQMQQRLINPQQNTAREADFPQTPDYQKCRVCNFRAACGRTDN